MASQFWKAVSKLADDMTGGEELTMDSPVRARAMAKFQRDMLVLQEKVSETLVTHRRLIDELDRRLEILSGAPAAEIMTIPTPTLLPKQAKQARKSRAKSKTQAVKRKRRTKAQMLADAAQG